MRRPGAPASALTLAVVLLLERLRPYFFLQDDNRDQFLPFFVHDARALAHGSLALFNWHQYLGVPHLAAGQTAVLYPPVYLCVAASRLLLGHVFGAIDLLVALQLAAGAWGMARLSRRLGHSPEASLLASLGWGLGAYAVLGCQFWHLVSAVVCYLPWLVELSLQSLASGRARDGAVLAAVRTLAFFTGYPEFFLYLCLFEGGFLLLSGAFRRASPRARLVWAASGVLSALLSAPLLLPLLEAPGRSALRAAALPLPEQTRDDMPFGSWLLGLAWPPASASGGSFFRPELCALTFLGWPVAALLASSLRRARGKVSREALSLALPAAVALAWAFGWLDPLLRVTPLLDRFRFHFKLLLFADFFLCLLAARELTRLSSPALARAALAAQLLGAALWPAVLPPQGPLIDTSPVPLREPLAAELEGGRLASLGPQRWGPARRAPLLGFAYATLWKLDHLAGYDPLVPLSNYRQAFSLNEDALLDPARLAAPDAPARLRRWGVRWYVVDRAAAADYAPFLKGAGAALRFSDDDRLVYEDQRAWPMVSWRDGSAAGLSPRMSVNALEVDCDSTSGGEVVVNALRQPGLSLRLDGAPAELRRDDDQLAFSVPPGRHRAELRYEEPGFTLGLALAAAGLLGAALAAARLRR